MAISLGLTIVGNIWDNDDNGPVAFRHFDAEYCVFMLYALENITCNVSYLICDKSANSPVRSSKAKMKKSRSKVRKIRLG